MKKTFNTWYDFGLLFRYMYFSASYIKACSRSDPNINECAKKQAINTIPHILKGKQKFQEIPQYLTRIMLFLYSAIFSVQNSALYALIFATV